jgi:hypothetical protein
MSAPVDPTAEACQLLLSQLVDQLADALAPRLAESLLAQQAQPVAMPASRRLLTIDELVSLLPPGKRPQTWKAWLYERTRHGQVPGCHKLGGRLFFDPEHTIPWLTGNNQSRLDLTGDQSLHQAPMPSEPSGPGRSGT